MYDSFNGLEGLFAGYQCTESAATEAPADVVTCNTSSVVLGRSETFLRR